MASETTPITRECITVQWFEQRLLIKIYSFTSKCPFKWVYINTIQPNRPHMAGCIKNPDEYTKQIVPKVYLLYFPYDNLSAQWIQKAQTPWNSC